MKIVNIVSKGDIDSEIDLATLFEEIDTVYKKYEPKKFPALQMRFEDDGPIVQLFRSGKYTITGASFREQLQETDWVFHNKLKEVGVFSEEKEQIQSKIVNIVCTADLEKNVDLSTLLTIVGFENSEYEPEQSPFLVYRPPEYDCVMTIAASGKIVVNGVVNMDTARESVEHLKSSVTQYL